MQAKKLIRWIALAVVLCMTIGLIACNGGGGYVDPELPEGYDVTPSGKIRVSMWLRSGESSEIALDNWIKVYNQKYPALHYKNLLYSCRYIARKQHINIRR